MRTVRNDVDKVEILHIGNLAIGPHAHNIAQFQLHHFLALLFQVPVHHFPGRLLIEHKQQRVRVIVKPDFNAYLLEEETVACYEL